MGLNSCYLNPVKVRAKVAAMRRVESRPQQFMGVYFNGLTNLDKFHDIDAPFAAFVFGDK